MWQHRSAVERYDAFISYSHVASGHVARAIQNGLQHLAKPFYKLRAIRVFRDETDLSAASDLGNEIREALEKSRYFVLLASPEAARSNWVRQEVQYWLEKKDPERLLIVCTQGSIAWRDGDGRPGSGDFDWDQTNALPANLMHVFEHEPHWVSLPQTTSEADLSRRNPLFMREVARIAAPIRGMELTELVNADRREHRRTLLLAWSAVIGLALLAAIALVLYVRATEANRESLSRLAVNHWASAVRARVESDDLRAAHEFARAANVHPDETEAAHSAFNSRVLLRSQLVSILEHNAPVLGARFSPDGKRVLTWDSSNMARLWKVADGVLIANLPHGDPVQFGRMNALFIDDGKGIVTVGSRNLYFWDGENGAPSQGADEKFAFGNIVLNSDGHTLLAEADWRGVVQLLSAKDGHPLGPPLKHDKGIRGAIIDSSGRQVLSWDMDGELRVWDAVAGTLIASGVIHPRGVVGAMFLQGDQRVLSWGYAGVTRLWNSQDGTDVVPPMRHNEKVQGARLSPDGQAVLTWSFDDTARLWSTVDGTPLIPPLRHEANVNGGLFDASGERILTWSDDGSTRMWQRKDGLLDRLVRWEAGVKGAILLEDGQHARERAFEPSQGGVAVSWGGQLRDGFIGLWDIGRIVNDRLVVRHPGGVRGVQIDGEGARVLSWDEPGSDRAGTVKLWHIADGQPVSTRMLHGEGINGAVFGPDDHNVLTWSRDGTARVWRLEPTPVARTEEHAREVIGVVSDQAGRRIVTYSFDGTARLWDEQLAPIGAPMTHDRGSVEGAQFSDDEQRLLTWGWDKTVRLWNTNDASPVMAPMRHDRPVEEAFFCCDERLIVARDEQVVRLWNANNGELVAELPHEKRLASAFMDSAQKRLLSVGRDGVRLWSLSTGQPLIEGVLHAPVDEGRSIPRGAAFVAADQRILSWDADRVKLWNESSGAWQSQLLAPEAGDDKRSSFTGVSVSPDGSYILVRQNQQARVWHAGNGEVTGKDLVHDGRIEGAEFDLEGERVLTWVRGGAARVWQLPGNTPLGEPMIHQYLKRAEFVAGGRQILTLGERSARLWSAQDAMPITAFMVNENITGATLSPDERSLMIRSNKDGVVQLWNARDGSPTGLMLRHPRSPFGVRARFHPDGQRIITWFADNAARIWRPSAQPRVEPEQQILQTEVLTGTKLDVIGNVQPLSPGDWRDKKAHYDAATR
jgi:WD40 repeat protein